MTFRTLKADQSGFRTDSFLAEGLEMSRNEIQRLIELEKVTLNGKAVKKNYKTVQGDTFLVEIPEPEQTELAAQDIALDVIYEDEDLIVINKPKGMVVHPAPGHPDGTLVNALLNHCGNSLSGIGGQLRPGIVHRIDKDTSGLIIAAKNDFAHQALSAQLKDKSLSRVYETIAVGGLRDDEGRIDAPIGRHPTDRKKMAVTQKNSRSAVTNYKVLERFDGFTYLQCSLETGRTHQIRVHLAYIGHPVLGDTVYGSQKPVKGLEGQCLHAKKLRFVHPRTGENVFLECSLPEYFENILGRLK